MVLRLNFSAAKLCVRVVVGVSSAVAFRTSLSDAFIRFVTGFIEVG